MENSNVTRRQRLQWYANCILRPFPLCLYGGRLYRGLRGHSNAIIYPSARIAHSKSSRITVRGTFRFGVPWPATDRCITSMWVADDATLLVEGAYRIYAGTAIHVNPSATLILGAGGFMNGEVRISCFSKISIGNGTLIGEQVMIRDSNDHDIVRDGYVRTSPIAIGDHCWIGSRAMILNGVEIGAGSVVAAGSVVRGQFPPKSLIAGVPAKVIRTDIEWH